jgi:hypothetical protein
MYVAAQTQTLLLCSNNAGDVYEYVYITTCSVLFSCSFVTFLCSAMCDESFMYGISAIVLGNWDLDRSNRDVAGNRDLDGSLWDLDVTVPQVDHMS